MATDAQDLWEKAELAVGATLALGKNVNLGGLHREASTVPVDVKGTIEACEEPEEELIKTEVKYIRWDPTTFHDRRSKVVYVENNHLDVAPMFDETAIDAVERLNLVDWVHKHQYWDGGVNAVISLIGDDTGLQDFLNDEKSEREEGLGFEDAKVRNRLFYGRGVARAALETHAVIVTSGLDQGSSYFMGRANRDRLHTLPVVGVAGKGTSSWPGDDRPMHPDRTELQPDHTHFVMTDNYTQDTVSVWQLKVELCKALASGKLNRSVHRRKLRDWWKRKCEKEKKPALFAEEELTVKQRRAELKKCATGISNPESPEAKKESLPDPKFKVMTMVDLENEPDTDDLNPKPVSQPLPRIAVLVHGDATALLEATQMVRMGWPLVIVRGTGGAADFLARALIDPEVDVEVPLPHIMEIVKEGKTEVLDLGDVDGSIVRQLMERLFGMPPPKDYVALMLGWDLQCVYMATAVQVMYLATMLKYAILILGVGLTMIVILKVFSIVVLDFSADSPLHKFSYLLIIAWPAGTSVLRAIDNRFQPAQKVKILTAAAESITSETFKYRTGCADYLSVAAARKDKVFSSFMNQVRLNVVSSTVGEVGLSHNAVEALRRREYEVSDLDNGLETLGPEAYITTRVFTLLKFYEGSIARLEVTYRNLSSLSIQVAGFGLLITALPVMADVHHSTQVLLAICTALSTTISTYIGNENFVTKLGAYNRAAVEIRAALAWWRALSSVEKANPQKMANLVDQVENAKFYEMQATNPGAASLTKGGGDGGGVAGINAGALCLDLIENINKGKIKFERAWLDRHPGFFITYNEYLKSLYMPDLILEVKQEELARATSGGGDKESGPKLTIQEQELGVEGLPAYSGVAVDDGYGYLKSIQWSPYDFVKRTTRVVHVPNNLEDIADVVKKLKLEEYLCLHQRWGKGPKAVVIVLGGVDYIN
ncbi:hypothetical protein CYMTET_19445, partial [Cymbomonas tetramitiformis]